MKNYRIKYYPRYFKIDNQHRFIIKCKFPFLEIYWRGLSSEEELAAYRIGLNNYYTCENRWIARKSDNETDFIIRLTKRLLDFGASNELINKVIEDFLACVEEENDQYEKN